MGLVLGVSPVKGRSALLDEEFSRWWWFLNELGLFALLIAFSIHGGPHQYFKALIALGVFGWIWYNGKRVTWPRALLERIELRDPGLVKHIKAEYLSTRVLVSAYLPFAIGAGYLMAIAIAPLLHPAVPFSAYWSFL